MSPGKPARRQLRKGADRASRIGRRKATAALLEKLAKKQHPREKVDR